MRLLNDGINIIIGLRNGWDLPWYITLRTDSRNGEKL